MTYGVIIDGETYVAEIAKPDAGCTCCDLPIGCCSIHDFGAQPIECFPAFVSSKGQHLHHMKHVIFIQPVKESKS